MVRYIALFLLCAVLACAQFSFPPSGGSGNGFTQYPSLPGIR